MPHRSAEEGIGGIIGKDPERMERATGFEPANFSLAKPLEGFRHAGSRFVRMALNGTLDAF
jgi:hypothetical protein